MHQMRINFTELRANSHYLLRSKPSIVGQSDEVGHFVERHLVVVDPPVALPHAAVNSVFPNAAG